MKRVFTTEYKAKILAEYQTAGADRLAILTREKLSASNIAAFKKTFSSTSADSSQLPERPEKTAKLRQLKPEVKKPVSTETDINVRLDRIEELLRQREEPSLQLLEIQKQLDKILEKLDKHGNEKK